MMTRTYDMHPFVPKGLAVAFYKGNRPGMKGVLSRIGRHLDHGPYSHTEMIFSDGLSASSSYEDGGVRFKRIRYSHIDRWDFLPIPDDTGFVELHARLWYEQHKGVEYDIRGNLRFLTNLVSEDRERVFCVESQMAAFGFPEPWRYGPSGAAKLLMFYFHTKMIQSPSPKFI